MDVSRVPWVDGVCNQHPLPVFCQAMRLQHVLWKFTSKNFHRWEAGRGYRCRPVCSPGLFISSESVFAAGIHMPSCQVRNSLNPSHAGSFLCASERNLSNVLLHEECVFFWVLTNEQDLVYRSCCDTVRACYPHSTSGLQWYQNHLWKLSLPQLHGGPLFFSSNKANSNSLS